MRQQTANVARRTAVTTVALLVALALSGCADSSSPIDGSTSLPDGRPAPRRIVCGSPAVAEIVFALGGGERVVGVSDHTIFPPEATKKTPIGGWMNPNRERLLMLKPDLIISQGRHDALASFAEAHGIRYHSVILDSLACIYAAIESIADALDVQEAGKRVTDDIRRAIESAGRDAAGAPPKRALVLFGRAPGSFGGLHTIGPGTFLDDIVRAVGGANLFADAIGAYPQVSKESILVRRPEAILELNPGHYDEETLALMRADWKAFGDIPAVRENRIHILTNDFLLIPGPRVGQVAEVFGAAIRAEGLREQP